MALVRDLGILKVTGPVQVGVSESESRFLGVANMLHHLLAVT